MKIPNSRTCDYGRYIIITFCLFAAVARVHASYQSVVQADNPISYFSLDSLDPSGSGTATDLSGQGNNAPYVNVYPTTGPTTFVPNAGLFDPSTSSSVSLPASPVLNFSGPITMEAWVQPTAPSQSLGDIVAKGYDATANLEDVLRVNQNQFQGGSYSNGVTKMAVAGPVTTNWVYVVTTFDGTNWNMYLNTVLVGQTSDSSGALNFTDPWAIGSGTVDGSTRFFQGSICQVALYTNALTSAQIINHYTTAEINTPATTAVPVIATQPQSQASYVSATVSFSVVAASLSPATNLWFKNNAPMLGQTNATLTLTNLSLSDAGNYTVVVGNANGTTNSAVAVLSVRTPLNLQWSASGNSGTWDINTSANWINQSNSQATVFNEGDAVLFDDTPGAPTSVNISGLVTPSKMVVNSSVNNYTFNPYSPGANTVAGSVSLTKKGSSTLTLATAGEFAGPVDIEGGAVLAEGYSFQYVPSIIVTNNAMVDFAGGQYSNPQQTIYVSGTGTSGQGALFNSLYGISLNFNVVLTGDAKIGCIGGTSGFGMSGGSISGPHTLTLDWNNVNGYCEWDGPIAIGANVVGITITNGTLGMKYLSTACANSNTVFTAGTNTTFAWWNGTGGFNGSIHMSSNSIARLWSAGTVYNGSTITLDGLMDWSSWGDAGDIAIDSPVTLNGMIHIIIGDHNLVYTNVISGSGGLYLDFWNHAMILSAANTYTGPTIINANGPKMVLTGNGSISQSSLIFFGGSDPTVTHLDATGRGDQTFRLASGQTLGGVGAINGSLVVSSGAVVSPAGTNTVQTMDGPATFANAVGTIAASNNVTLNGTTVIKLDGSGTNDVVQAATNITYGGTLNLVNISGSPLAAGNSFQVFSAASYTGSFTSITPSTPGPGLAWDTTHLNSGQIGVITGPAGLAFNSVSAKNGSIVFSGAGGPASASYRILSTTNLASPFVNWTPVLTNAFDTSGNFSATNAINSSTRQIFYRLVQP